MDDHLSEEIEASLLSSRPRAVEFSMQRTEDTLYGQRNTGLETRRKATQKDFFGGSIICNIDLVSYGQLNGKRACLVVFGFRFRYDASNLTPLKRADVQIAFRPLTRKGLQSRSSSTPVPVVRAAGPGKLLGKPDESGESWSLEFSKVCESTIMQVPVPASESRPSAPVTGTLKSLKVKGEPWSNERQQDGQCDMACLAMTETGKGSIGILNPFSLVVIVESQSHFQAYVEVDVDLTWRQKLKAFPFPPDDPVLFIEGKESTPIGRKMPVSNFEDLSGEQWRDLILGREVANEPNLSMVHAEPPPKATTAKAEYQTFRIQGIPSHVEKSNIGQLLAGLLETGPLDDVDVRSLACDPRSPRELTACILSESVAKVLGSRKRATFNHSIASNAHAGRVEIVIDVLFEDFTVINVPEGTIDVDIIALSGLGAHSFGSFKDRGGRYMWLADRLPLDFPRARIMVYGYETRLLHSRSFQDLEAIANTMRSAIKTVLSQGSHQSRPVIFIAHSLGGLVLKHLLLQMIKGDDRDSSFLDCIRGLLMFGVPHLGMNIEPLRGKVKDQPNEPFLQALRPDSESLRRLNRDFKERFQHESCKIVSFYETDESPTAREADGSWVVDGPPAVMVSQDSATGGARPWEFGPNYEHALKRTHSDMVKFYPRDPCYFVVRDVINTLVGDEQ